MINRKILIGISLIAMFGLLFGGIQAPQTTQAATVTFPNADKLHVAGFDLLAVDYSYDRDDYMLTGTDGDTSILDLWVPGTEIPKTDASVDLSESTFYSDSFLSPTWVDDSPWIEDRVFTNATYNAAVLTEEDTESDAVATSEMQSQTHGTQLYALGTFGDNNTAYQTLDFKSDMSYDSNNDGDFADAGDKAYNPWINENMILYWCVMTDFSDITDTGYTTVDFSFKTSVATNYVVSIVFYPVAGDADWSDDDASGENKITWTLYDTDAEWIAMQFDIGELLEKDLGDNPTILGLDYINVELRGVKSSVTMAFSARNFCWWESMKGVTDSLDNDSDWLIDDDNGIPAGIWDDNDFLLTEITEAATDTYDSAVALRNKVDDNEVLDVAARCINFEGVAQIDIADNVAASDDSIGASISSVYNSDGYYTTTVVFEIDTRALDDMDAPTTYWIFTDFWHNLTLSQDVLYDNWDEFEESFVTYEFEHSNSPDDTVRTAWDGATADNYLTYYDHTSPSATTGALQHFMYKFLTDSSYSGAVTPEDTETAAAEEGPAGQLISGVDNSILFVCAAVIAGVGILFLLSRRK